MPCISYLNAWKLLRVWMRCNGLNKTEWLWVFGRHLVSWLPLEKQVVTMARRAFAHLRVMCVLCQFLDWEALLSHSCPLFRTELYMGLPLKSLLKLQLVENAAALGRNGIG